MRRWNETRETRNRHFFGVKAKMPPSTCATSSTPPWRLCRTDANDTMIFSTTMSPCCRCLTRTLTKSWGANQCRGHGKCLERPDLETGSQMSLTEFIGSIWKWVCTYSDYSWYESFEADAVFGRKLQAGMIFMQLQNTATGLHMVALHMMLC